MSLAGVSSALPSTNSSGMPQLSVMARKIVLFDVPGGPSSSKSRPEDTAARTRSISRVRPTILAASAARRSASVVSTSYCLLRQDQGGAADLLAEAGVHRQRHAGDVTGLVGGEPQHGVADVDRLDPRDGQAVEAPEGVPDVVDRG